jgi:hypothetical protein
MLGILFYGQLKPRNMCDATDRVLTECERHILAITANFDKDRPEGGESLGNANLEGYIGLGLG